MSMVAPLGGSHPSQELGDTQVFPTQIITSYLEGKSRPFGQWDDAMQMDQEFDGTNETEFRTYATGDTGHVNLVQTLDTQEPHQSDLGEDEDSEDDLASTSQIAPRTMTSPTYLSPTTPSLAGQKRDHHGNIVSPPSRTPLPNLAAFFAADPGNGVMGLSQVFKQTQADSSPFPIGPRSDPIFERPSPDVRPPYHTSPIGTMSSPVYSMRPGIHRGTSEPRPIYVSMKHSQELRERQKREVELLSLQLNSDDEDELGEGSEERRAARRRSTEKLRSDAMKSFATFGAPRARLSTSEKKYGMRSIKGKTPKRTSRRNSLLRTRDVIVISDDVQEGARETADSSEQESVDEYDEFSQAVISSERYEEEGGDTPVEEAVSTPRARGVERVTRAASSPLLRERRSQDEQLRRSFPEAFKSQSSGNGSLGVDMANFFRMSQTVAVADSQPDNNDHGLVPPPRPVLPSSIDSRGFISQSQGFSLSSNSRAELAATPLIDTGLGASSLPQVPLLYGLSESELQTFELQDPPSSPPEIVHAPARKSIDDSEENEDILHLPSANPTREPREENPSLEEGAHAITSSQSRLTAKSNHSAIQHREALVQTIPETSPTATPDARSSSNLNAATGPPVPTMPFTGPEFNIEGRSEDESGKVSSESVMQYQTARTHQSLSPIKHSSAVSRSEGVNVTPPRPQIRKMTEISADLPPPTPPSARLFDVTIMNDDDLDFHTTILGSSAESPPKKRMRRPYGQKTVHATATEENSMPSRIASAAKTTGSTDIVPVADDRGDGAELRDARALSTPPSVKRREELGAAAAINARQNLTLRTTSSRRLIKRPPQTASKSKQYARKAATPARAVPSHSRPEIDETPHATHERASSPAREDEEEAGSTVGSTVHRSPAARRTSDDEVSPPEILHTRLPATQSQNPNVSNRVLARFKDLNMRFYPATCLGLAGPKSSVYRVRFDDGTVDQIDAMYIKRFELQAGDLIRIDLHDKRTKTWIVKGLKDRLTPRQQELEEFPLTDRLGHKTLAVEVKQRQSLPANGRLPRSESIDIPISSIYFTVRDWRGIEGRQYQHHLVIDRGQRLQTPVNMPSLPNTPASRTRRHTINNIVPSAVQVSMDGYGATTGIFSNMAFAITYSTNKDAEKTRISRQILDHGGRILSEGFDELFDLPQTPIASPTKSPRTSSTSSSCHLTLSPNAAKLGFTALIADTHSRRSKYMQALALNIPCLSGRWIADCATKQQLLPWHRYLLPAGESSFLDGAIRSRTFAIDPATTDGRAAALSTTIAERPRLLDGKNVVLVMGKGKEEERRRPYLFLTYALGASRVERVRDLKAAKALLDGQERGGKWDWVYVDGGKIELARNQLRGAVADVDAVAGVEQQRGKKRKRAVLDDEDVGEEDVCVKVVGDEFVIQSLILGALLEDA